MTPLAEIRAALIRSPLVVLWRAFLEQFLLNESATSDAQVVQALIWAITILLPPGVFMMVMVFPAYENIVMYHPRLVDEARLRLALVLVMYAMATVGYIAVFVWEGLTFDRRDAMVIGPLPVRGATVVGAKLAALATLLLTSALAINLVTAVSFGSLTANHLGLDAFVRGVSADLAATIGAATFVFSSLVVARALVTLLGSPRQAARLGSLLQFLFVAGLLCFVLLLPTLLAVRRADLIAAAPTTMNPITWFLGLFEYLYGSSEQAFATLAGRAALTLTLSVTGAVVLSIVSVHTQMQRALVPVASAGALGRARLSRVIARALVGRDLVARATADFILLTVARNRAQQTPIANTCAIGFAIVIAALYGLGRASKLHWSMRPTIELLWVPLAMTFWMAIGVRASFFVPSELPASWSFRVNAPELGRSYWSAARAAMFALVLPPILLLTALLGIVMDWWVVAWHCLFVGVMTLLLAQVLSLTIAHIPFIRPYQPGHAKLRTRWPFYFFGMSAFAWWPVQVEIHFLGTSPAPGGEAMAAFAGALLTLLVLLEAVGRYSASRWMVEPPETSVDDSERLSVLDLGATAATAYELSNGKASH